MTTRRHRSEDASEPGPSDAARTSTRGRTRASAARGARDRAESGSADHPLVRLQRRVGNRAVQRLVDESRSGDQPTLKMSRPGDRYEREADRVATTVMRSGRSPTLPTVTDRTAAPSRRTPELCSRCRRCVEQGTPLNCKTCDAVLQRSATPSDPSESPESIPTDGLHRRSQPGRRGGRRLPDSVRTFFESRFGTSFDDVRLYSDASAAASARALDARAYTLGRDVVFGAGEYAPETESGRRLLAHELTHVVQQRSRPPVVQRLPKTTPAGDPYNKGVKHDHRPTGEWEAVQERTRCDLFSASFQAEAIPDSSGGTGNLIGCYCKISSPEEVITTAREWEMSGQPLAKDHLNNYLSGAGEYEEDVEAFLKSDTAVFARLIRFADTGGDSGHFKLQQSHYSSDEYRNSFGAIDRLDYRVDTDAGVIHVWFADRYEWHPVYPGLYTKKSGDVTRYTNCVHAAAVEMKLEGARDFWMYGHGTVPLPESSGEEAEESE